VLRGAPQSCFRLVTPRARLAADEARRCRSFTSIPQPKTDPTDNDDKRRGEHREPERACLEKSNPGFVGQRLLRCGPRRLSGRSFPRSIRAASFASLTCQWACPQCRACEKRSSNPSPGLQPIIGRTPAKSNGRWTHTEPADQFGQRAYFISSSSPMPGKVRDMVLSSMSFALN
jgi:hypothetical protein